MKKYFLVARNTWAETVSYRLSFIMWRFRVVLQILTIYFLWFSILPKNTNFLGYSQEGILTYILGTSLISSIVIASRSFIVGEEINTGALSYYLLRPVNYFMYWFAKDAGDKAMNIAFSILELGILFLILKPPLFIQTNFLYILFFLISIFLAVIMYFFLSFLIGLFGFWSPEVWGPRFIFQILLTFFAGGLFPLDIMPKTLFFIFQLLPFPYLLYFPLKIYLGHLPIIEIYKGFFILIAWTIILYWFLQFVWKKGLRSYAAFGR